MSGGSFNYLTYVSNLSELLEKWEELGRMAEALDEYGANDAAMVTREIIRRVDELEDYVQRILEAGLDEVWKAVEWHHSSDYGEEKVHTAIKEWSEKR